MKTSDVVYLKSGSPGMVIRDIDGDFATCEWLDVNTHRQEEAFAIASLTRTPTDQHFLPLLPSKYGTLPSMSDEEMDVLYQIMEGKIAPDIQQLELFAKAFFHSVNRASGAQADADLANRRLTEN